MKQETGQQAAGSKKDDLLMDQMTNLELRMSALDNRVIMLQEQQEVQMLKEERHPEVLAMLSDLFDYQINAALMAAGCTPSASETLREYALGLGFTVVAGKSSANINVQPQVVFRPERLVIPASIADFFLITDIKVGKNSQLVSTGAIPASAFAQRSEASRMKMDTVQISMFVTVSVFNISNEAQNFQGVIFGPAVEGDWLSATPRRFLGRRPW